MIDHVAILFLGNLEKTGDITINSTGMKPKAPKERLIREYLFLTFP
jgi:hypothetical protein